MIKISVLACIFLLIVSFVSAEEDKYDIQAQPHEKMTKTEMIKEIKGEMSDSDDKLLVVIPELKKQKDKSGDEFYTYHVDASDVKLEDLDDNILDELLKKVYIENSRIQVQENIDIVETARQAQRASKNYQPVPAGQKRIHK